MRLVSSASRGDCSRDARVNTSGSPSIQKQIPTITKCTFTLLLLLLIIVVTNQTNDSAPVTYLAADQAIIR